METFFVIQMFRNTINYTMHFFTVAIGDKKI